jgi:hypothetical protein
MFGRTVFAEPITLNDYPDIFSEFITVDYIAATDQLTATGFARTLDDDGSVPAEDITGGSFDLLATVTDAGLLTGGTLSIGGTVPTLGFNSGTLLTGSLTSVIPTPGDPLEFTFDITGGDAAGLYGGTQSTLGGIILSGSGFTGDWTSDFTGGAFQSLADVGVVPEPSTVSLLASVLVCGVGGFSLRRFRRKK